jgi:hypothetical protein
MPNISFNPLAFGLATAALFFLAYVWYVPLFGRAWCRELGFAPDHEPQGGALAKALGITLLGALLTAMVLNSTMAVWLPQTWGVDAPAPSPLAHAAQAAFFTWLGFQLPVLLRRVAWEQRSWTLLAIDAGFQLVATAAAATIFAFMR